MTAAERAVLKVALGDLIEDLGDVSYKADQAMLTGHVGMSDLGALKGGVLNAIGDVRRILDKYVAPEEADAKSG